MSTHNLCFEQKYENIRVFLSENFQFLEVKFSIYLNRRVFVMTDIFPLILLCFSLVMALSLRDHIKSPPRLTLSLPQAIIIGFCKQHRSR